MTVSGEREVQVKIEKDTPDGIILYYDTTLYDDGTYEFLLDSCEYNIGTGEYDSSFTVTVQDKSDSLACYTQKNMVVVDPGLYHRCVIQCVSVERHPGRGRDRTGERRCDRRSAPGGRCLVW